MWNCQHQTELPVGSKPERDTMNPSLQVHALAVRMLETGGFYNQYLTVTSTVQYLHVLA